MLGEESYLLDHYNSNSTNTFSLSALILRSLLNPSLLPWKGGVLLVLLILTCWSAIQLEELELASVHVAPGHSEAPVIVNS